VLEAVKELPPDDSVAGATAGAGGRASGTPGAPRDRSSRLRPAPCCPGSAVGCCRTSTTSPSSMPRSCMLSPFCGIALGFVDPSRNVPYGAGAELLQRASIARDPGGRWCWRRRPLFNSNCPAPPGIQLFSVFRSRGYQIMLNLTIPVLSALIVRLAGVEGTREVLRSRPEVY